jgi:hypothetical protein
MKVMFDYIIYGAWGGMIVVSLLYIATDIIRRLLERSDTS